MMLLNSTGRILVFLEFFGFFENIKLFGSLTGLILSKTASSAIDNQPLSELISRVWRFECYQL